MIRNVASIGLHLATLCLAVATLRADSTLRELADARGIRIGAMILDPSWESPDQQALVAREFNAATIGTYWKRTRPAAATFDWSVTDKAVAWAADAGLAIHLHPLIYPANEFNPEWLTSSARSTAPSILKNHITNAMTRYRAGSPHNPSDAVAWDVVNEAVSPAGTYRNSWWQQAMPALPGEETPQYIIKAFEVARAADPNAILLYNDHDIELSNVAQSRKWARVQEIVTALHAKRLIDGLGWQLHTNADEVLGEQLELQPRMKWVKSLGLSNYVTELDMELGSRKDALARQGAAYKKVAEIWLAENHGGWLQTWGVSDKHSWLGDDAEPLLFDEHYAAKPAYEGVREAVAATAADAAPARKGVLQGAP